MFSSAYWTGLSHNQISGAVLLLRWRCATVVLEYSSEGRVLATGQPYGNRYISVAVFKDRKVNEWRDHLEPLCASPAARDARLGPTAR
jgi:hypothetical protein